ncbi:MAG: DUF1015 domain-containing protein [Phycisphaerales bacterium]
MPNIYPFPAIQFLSGKGDASALIAPPYDVLDNAGKNALLARNARNVVGIDLPHTPAKELGPPSAYEGAATALRAMLADRTLTRQPSPSIFAYRQTFRGEDGVTHQRCGMACTVDVVPFGPRKGGGVLPHEETFSGPKEDRFALMKATRTQLSPIFGLFADEAGRATRIVRDVMGKRGPDMTATMNTDKVLHEVWTITDSPTIKAYQDALAGEDIFIADGHHRYTTQINYLKHLESQGAVAPDHPARRSMMVLVGMSDPGLVIWPTHRVLGGMKDYSLDAFLKASAPHMKLEPITGGLEAVHHAMHNLSRMGEERFAVWDFTQRRGFVACPARADALGARFPEKPRAWRELSVAFCQYVIVEQVCQAQLNAGQPVKWAFPHTVEEVDAIGRGAETGAGGGAGFAQLAVLVRPTPLQAVKDVSRANQLMPQKSTFFYPKLATGLFMNALDA